LLYQKSLVTRMIIAAQGLKSDRGIDDETTPCISSIKFTKGRGNPEKKKTVRGNEETAKRGSDDSGRGRDKGSNTKKKRHRSKDAFGEIKTEGMKLVKRTLTL